MENLNLEFKAWRKAEGLTQAELAELIGISRGSYQRFEQLNAAGMKVFNKIIEFYGNTIDPKYLGEPLRF